MSSASALIFAGVPAFRLPGENSTPAPTPSLFCSAQATAPDSARTAGSTRIAALDSAPSARTCIKVVSGKLAPQMGATLAAAARILGLEEVKLAVVPDVELELLFPAYGVLGAPPAAFSTPSLSLVVVRSSRAGDLPLLIHELGHLAAWGGPARIESWAEEALVEAVAQMLAAYLRDPRCASPEPPAGCGFAVEGEPLPYDPFASEEEWQAWMELDPARAYSLAFRWAEAQPWSRRLDDALELMRRVRTENAATLLVSGLPAHSR